MGGLRGCFGPGGGGEGGFIMIWVSHFEFEYEEGGLFVCFIHHSGLGCSCMHACLSQAEHSSGGNS